VPGPGGAGLAVARPGTQAADPIAEGRHTITLLATAVGGSPVAGVDVTIIADGADLRAGAAVAASGTTDAAGRVRVTLPRGTWRARVRHERFHAEPATFDAPAAGDVPLRLFPGVPLLVRVRDGKGEPVAGAQVRLLEFGFGQVYATDAEGLARLGGVHPTWEALLVRAPGFLEAFAWANQRWRHDPAVPLDVSLARAAPLLVRVVRAGDGIPEPGARVWARASGGDSRGTTGEDGTVQFEAGAAPPTTQISATTPDGRRGDVTIPVASAEPHEVVVTVSAGTAVPLLAVRADGRPVADAAVFRRVDERWTEVGRTDADGRYRIERARENPLDGYEVRVRAVGLAGPDDDAEPEADGSLRVVLLPTETWVGRVVLASGAPASGAVVTAGHPGDVPLRTRPAEARTDPDGRWRIEDVPRHPDLVALAESAAHGLAWSDDDVPAAQDGVVTLPDLVLPGTFTLDVPVVDEEGEPVPAAWLVIRQRVRTQGERIHWRTVERGRFHPLQGLSRPFVAVEVTARGFLPDAVAVRADTERLVLHRPQRVRGRLVRPDGSPVAGAGVRLHAKDRLHTLEGNAAAATTDATGAFEAQGIRRGRYDVEVAGGARAVVTVSHDGQDLGDVVVGAPR
jgi:hypothetical protein